MEDNNTKYKIRMIKKFLINFAYFINCILFPPAKVMFILWTISWISTFPSDTEMYFGQKIIIVLFGYFVMCGIADLIYFRNKKKYLEYKMKITQKQIRRLKNLMNEIDPVKYITQFGYDDVAEKKNFLQRIFHKEPSAVEKAQMKLQRAKQLAGIINTTYDFEEFTNSFDELIKNMEFLKAIENCSFFTGTKPSEDLATINKNKHLTEKEFIDRYIYQYGKDGLIGKEYYLDKFSEESVRYVNSILGKTVLNTKTSLKNNYDYMEGHQFEYFCADILRKNGFINVEVTQGSGDHGIDILAEKDDITYAIQCKCYSSNIGNAAIQQAHTGKSLYHKDVAVVMTNQYFTQQAKEEAVQLGVKLWDRDKLDNLIEQTK